MSFTIAQVKAFPAGTVIPKLEGTLKKVFPPKTGEGQYGPWKLQGFVLGDGADEIKGTLFDSDDISYLQGKTVSIISSGKNGKTGKPQGLAVEASKKDGTPELNVKGKQGGIIAGDAANPAYMRGTPENAASSAPASAPSVANKPISAPQQGQGSDPTAILEKMAVFWLGCWNRAGAVSGLPEDTKQAMTSSLFIEGCRNQLWREWPAKAVPAPVSAPAESESPF